MMKHLKFVFYFLFFTGMFIAQTSCKKKQLFSTGNLRFSTDTLVFDTVFTTIGSVTKIIKIYNPQSKTIKINEVQLMGGSNSPFKLNLDGLQGYSFSDLELTKGDSLYCFVEVKLSINGQNLPLIVEDSIRFRTNGTDQYVKLAVWGQDMYYHYSNTGMGIFDFNEGTWPNDKPHVIYGAAFVDSAKTLNIIGGTKIHLHKNSMLWNYKGTLNIDGDYNNKVEIMGDRLESFYSDVPGQYYGIYFHEARPSMVDNLILKNATAGIHVYSRDANYSQNTLTISNTEIYNCASYGLFLFSGPKVYGENLIVHSCGVHALLVIQGATFTFNNSNFLGYGTGDGSTPAVGLSNKYSTAQGTFVSDIPLGDFNNCVIYGNTDEQLAFDTLKPNGVTINFHFRNCVIRRANFNAGYFSSCLASDPLFNSTSTKDFTFSSGSSLNNNGNPSYSPPLDIVAYPRNNPPDIGAFEN